MTAMFINGKIPPPQPQKQMTDENDIWYISSVTLHIVQMITSGWPLNILRNGYVWLTTYAFLYRTSAYLVDFSEKIEVHYIKNRYKQST